MAYPNFRGKHAQDALFTPQEFLRYQYKRRFRGAPTGKSPESMIFCYNGTLLTFILRHHVGTRILGFGADTWYLKGTHRKLGIIGNFGIGAPSAVAHLEELIAWGVKRFISIGTAGALQPGMTPGDIVVCDRAIRDEGTSHHYAATAKYAHPSPALTKTIEESLHRLAIPYTKGTSWTIDAPYRETVAEARRYQHEGVKTVEMEASALFTVAMFRRVQMAAMFTISDSLAGTRWKPKFHLEKKYKGLERLFQAATLALQR